MSIELDLYRWELLDDSDGVGMQNICDVEGCKKPAAELSGFQIINPSRLPRKDFQPLREEDLVLVCGDFEEEFDCGDVERGDWDGCVEMDDGRMILVEDYYCMMYSGDIARVEAQLDLKQTNHKSLDVVKIHPKDRRSEISLSDKRGRLFKMYDRRGVEKIRKQRREMVDKRNHLLGETRDDVLLLWETAC